MNLMSCDNLKISPQVYASFTSDDIRNLSKQTDEQKVNIVYGFFDWYDIASYNGYDTVTNTTQQAERQHEEIKKQRHTAQEIH